MMEGQHRTSSPSAGPRQSHIISHPSSLQHYPDQLAGLNLDPSINPSTFANNALNKTIPSTNGAEQYTFSTAFLEAAAQGPPFQHHTIPSSDFPNQESARTYKQSNSLPSVQQRPENLNLQQSNHQFSTEFLEADPPLNFVNPFQSQDIAAKQDRSYGNTFMLDPSLQTGSQPQNQSINPADIMSNMSSPQSLLPTPPNLMPPDSRSSPGQSPSSQQGQFYSPSHSRHGSLDPASAGFTHGQQPADWTGMLGGASFQQHRRAPSEHSEVSSVAPSPFLTQQDSFDSFDQNHSPMLGAQQDNMIYQDALERFSLSDAQHQQQQQQQQHQQQQQRAGRSPRHTPYASPRIPPHQGLGITQDNPFILQPNDIDTRLNGGPGPQIYASQADQGFLHFQGRHGSSDMGQAIQMAPPEINVELAPPSRQQSFEPPRAENDLDALSPPERGRRGRIRAKSDPSFTPISRPMSPAEISPSLVSIDPNQRNRSLSPFDASCTPSLSREASPASKSSRRSSTSSIPNRDYILELADPSRPPGVGRDRVQKHPATFQCTLCPKRFTRAYNLRSHLRTHTDERPFVCTVCGKAFARQHDRKRHEGLHSGEKKFVCRGELGAGGAWGCGRRFARADALGRHFRSEAGRVCIKPLLDEEAAERQRLFEEQMMGGQQGMQQQGLQPGLINGGMQPTAQGVGMNGGFTLPAALLAQYPALQGLQWDQLGAPGPGDEGELSGRSSFDAASGGDYFEDEEGGYVSGPGTGYGNAWGATGGHDWASDYEGR